MTLLFKEPGEQLLEHPTFGGVATIEALTSVVATSRGLVPGSLPLEVAPTLFAQALTLKISGGSDGERYLITINVIDADSEPRTSVIEVAVLDQGWAMPDGSPPMLSIAEFVDRVGLDEVVRMTDARGDGRIGKAGLVGALTDAQAMVEAHVGGRYRLPFDHVPTILKAAIADIARARLFPGELPQGVDTAMKGALRLLERVQSGAVNIIGLAELGAQGGGDPVRFVAGQRAYPDGLADF